MLELSAIAAKAEIERVHFIAWRDLNDPDAGGSELYAHMVASRWAAAGIDVTVRTRAVANAPRTVTRDGYRVWRSAGRYRVFPGAAWEGMRMGYRPGDALVETWNGMPFLSPMWYRGPRLVIIHHVHTQMWGMVLPSVLARVGENMERRLAPRFYRSSRIITPSESSRSEVVEMLGLPRANVGVASPGIDIRFSPGGSPSGSPLVVAVGRFTPIKRFDLLLRALVKAKTSVPELRAVIIGEGDEWSAVEALRRELGAVDWVDLPGRVSDDELVNWYRQAWLVASTSQREGWGMTLTEAAACGTPSVATAITGHVDSVVDGESGCLVDRCTPDGVGDFAEALTKVLNDYELRVHLSKGALARSGWLSWDATARRALEALASETTRHG